MDQYIAVNGTKFSLEELGKKLGITESIQKVDLCQVVESGTISARLWNVPVSEDPAPGIEMELNLPAEANSLPIKLCRAEQETGDPLKTYLYSRNDTYIAYTEVDTRPDAEEESDPMPAILVASGEGKADIEVVHVYKENRYVKFHEEGMK